PYRPRDKPLPAWARSSPRCPGRSCPRSCASASDVFAVEAQRRIRIRSTKDHCTAVMEHHHIMVVCVEFEQIGILFQRKEPAEGLAKQLEIQLERWRRHDLHRVATTERCRRQATAVFEKVELALSAYVTAGRPRHRQGREIVVPHLDMNEVRRYRILLADHDLEGFGALPRRDQCRHRPEYAYRFTAQRRSGRLCDIGQ